MKHTIAIAALVATSISFVAVPVMAQDSAGPLAVKAERQAYRDSGMGRGAGGFLNLVCSPRAAEQLEIALVRLSYRLSLTAEQTPLFDTFRDTALTTQTSFADDCAEAMPDRTADAAPDLIGNLRARLTLEEARLAGLNAVLSDFEALYASLSDEQKSGLQPRRLFQHDNRGTEDRGTAPGRSHRDGGPDRGNNTDRSQRAPAPGR